MIREITLIGAIPPPYGGISIYMKQIAQKLAEKGFKVEIIDFTGVNKKVRSKNIKLIKVNKSYGRDIFRALLRSNSQIFHVHASTYGVDPLLLTTAIIARLRKREFVITILGGAFLQFMKKPLYRKIFRLIALNRADGIITVDPAVYKRVLEVLPTRKRKTIHYFSPPVNTALFKPEISGDEVRTRYGIKNNQNIVMFGPHLEPIYAPDQFIKAAAVIIKKHANVVFMLVGEGSQDRYLRSLVKKLKLEKHVIFVRSIPHKKMPKYYVACDVHCNPCILGQGYSTLEALACGKPVVGARVKTQIRIKNKVDGLLFEPGNIRDLASKIIWLLEHSQKRKEMGIRGRNRIVKQNSLEIQVRKHIRIYDEIISK